MAEAQKDAQQQGNAKANAARLRIYKKCLESDTIKGILKKEGDNCSKLKIIFDSIMAKDPEDSPWFVSNIMAEAYQLFSCNDIKSATKEIGARIAALEELNHEVMALCLADGKEIEEFNPLKDFKFVLTVFSNIMSDLSTIDSIKKNVEGDIQVISMQQQKDIEYANEFLTKKSFPRIMTHFATITAALGASTIAFASDLRHLVDKIMGGNYVFLALGSIAAITSVVFFVTGQLINHFVNKNIKKIMDEADAKVKSLLNWQEESINEKVGSIAINAIGEEAYCGYMNDIEKRAPSEIIDAIQKKEWIKVTEWINSAIRALSSNPGESAGAALAKGIKLEIKSFDGRTSTPDSRPPDSAQ